jgi:ABC-type dipeptide/oligopeptide/nickel transport system permease component
MLRYIGKRFLQSLFVMVFVIFVAFTLVRIAPGSPAILMLPEGATDEQILAMEVQMGLDRPLFVQFFTYLGGLLQGDFGMSTMYNQPVLRIIRNALPQTARLAFATVAVVTILAIPLGIFAGAKRGKGLEVLTMGVAKLGQSMASILLGVLLVYI